MTSEARRLAQTKLTGDLLATGKEVSIALLRNPVASMVLGVATTEYLVRHNHMSSATGGLVVGSLLSASLLEAFKPIILGAQS